MVELAGIALTMLFVLLLPANVYAAVAEVPFNGGEPTPLWPRLVEQALYIGVAVRVARSADRTASGRLLRPAHPATPASH